MLFTVTTVISVMQTVTVNAALFSQSLWNQRVALPIIRKLYSEKACNEWCVAVQLQKQACRNSYFEPGQSLSAAIGLKYPVALWGEIKWVIQGSKC